MDPDTDVCQTEQPQISYSVDFIAEQSSAMGSPILLGWEGTGERSVSESYMCLHRRVGLVSLPPKFAICHSQGGKGKSGALACWLAAPAMHEFGDFGAGWLCFWAKRCLEPFEPGGLKLHVLWRHKTPGSLRIPLSSR